METTKQNKMNKPEKIDSKKINTFFRQLNTTEQIYVKYRVEISSSIRDIIRQYQIPKDIFCSEMKISKAQYKDYISGAKSYSLMDTARLIALSNKLAQEKLINESDKKNGKK